ncbi:MAG: TIGR01459 family HAD-type hydrolase [Pseudorhodoplanes sp.]|nr:TIGR01459 family HAD-type hydrolase [Pseudorhodoplanes sp.]
MLTRHFSTLAARYDVVLSDVWGVTHNGITATPEACDALMRFRAGGGTVILITNAPRRGEAVARQLVHFKVPSDVHDGIVSSGDVTCRLMQERAGQRVFHIGPERDLSIFEGVGTTFAPLEQADYVVCTGLFHDETETPDDYRGLIETMRARALPMICGNPDLVVERGDTLVFCAGAIADLYAHAGGAVTYAGKPYRPIYDMALKEAARVRGRPADPKRVIAIGDSVRTDIMGAQAAGIDCVFVTDGIHAEELGGRHHPKPEAVEKILSTVGTKPVAIMRRLAW